MFASFTQEDKEAFFALLDEYFASRPHLFPPGASSNANLSTAAASASNAAGPAVAAFQRAAVQNPEATANLVSAGAKTLNRWNQSQANSNTHGSPSQNESSPPPFSRSSKPDHLSSGPSAGVGRVAAAAANLSAKGLHRFNAPSASAAPSPPPAPTPPTSGSVPPRPPPTTNASTRPGSSAVPSAPPPPPAPPAPPAPAPPTAVSAPRASFNPPPVRRTNSGVGAPPPPPAAPGRGRISAPQPEPEPAEEWVEAAYDFESTDPGDLPLKEHQRVKVIEHTSDDWWTGELNGRRGLFPSSYVQAM